MIKSKTIDLIKTFTEEEMRSFADFVESPFFNKSADVTTLFFAIRQIRQEKIPTRQFLFQKAFPDKAFSGSYFNFLLSGLQDLAEQFLAWTQLQEEGFLKEYFVLKSFLNRRQDKGFLYLQKLTQHRLDAQPKRNQEYFFQKYLLSDLGDQYFLKTNVRRYDPNLQDAAQWLNKFYFSVKLRQMCGLIDRQKIVEGPYQTENPALHQHMVQELNIQDCPPVSIYNLFLSMLQEQGKPNDFETLKNNLQSTAAYFDLADRRMQFFLCLNYCMRKIRQGEKHFVEELATLYQVGLEEKILMENDRLSAWDYKNMVRLGLGLRRFEWVEAFVKNYSHYLAEEERQDALHFNLADIYYHKRDFGAAHQHLREVQFTDIHYSLDSKIMLLKIYFETEAEEAFLSLLSSFKIFLLREKKLPKPIKQPYINFIALVSALYKADNLEKMNKLSERITKTDLLTAKPWIMEKLAELKSTFQ